MPSTATITGSQFISFTAGQKARSSEVNGNFNIWRGHIIPVDPTASASADGSYDLGASDAQWRNIYLTNLPFINGSQLAKFPIDVVIDGINPPSNPQPINSLNLTEFQDAADQYVTFTYKVPPEYSPGNQMRLRMYGYCDASGGSYWVTESELFSPTITGGTVANVTITANVATNTTAIAAPSTSGMMFEDNTIPITDSNGLISAVTVTTNDIISFRLERRASDTSDSLSGSYFLTQLEVDLNA